MDTSTLVSNSRYKEFQGTWRYELGDISLELTLKAVKTVPVLAEGEILLNERLEGAYILRKNGQIIVNTSGQVHSPNYHYLMGRFEGNQLTVTLRDKITLQHIQLKLTKKEQAS